MKYRKRLIFCCLQEMRSPFTPEQRVNWEKYVARGGNLIILSEPNRRDVMGPVWQILGTIGAGYSG